MHIMAAAQLAPIPPQAVELELSIAYQPLLQVDGNDLIVIGYESLIRADSSICEQDTARLITAAEGDGSIVALDRWVFDRVCEDAMNHPGMRVWLNVSQLSIANDAFVSYFIEAAKVLTIERQITIEITETADGNLEEMKRNIERLHARALAVVIDDFDDGFAKRGLLSSRFITGCKLSRTTTDRLLTNPAQMDKVRTLVELCRGLGKTVVLEGIESELELSLARDLGVTHCQGYHLFKPSQLSKLPALGVKVPFPTIGF